MLVKARHSPALTVPCMQDAVPRSGKFWVLYKLGGHRVVINRMGDLVVRPSPLEASLRQNPAGISLCLKMSLLLINSWRQAWRGQHQAASQLKRMLLPLTCLHLPPGTRAGQKRRPQYTMLLAAVCWCSGQASETCIRNNLSSSSSASTPRWCAGLSVGQHLLAAYLKSLRAALRVQFTKKGLRGGKSGVVRLVEDSPVVQVSSFERRTDTEAMSASTYAGLLMLAQQVCGAPFCAWQQQQHHQPTRAHLVLSAQAAAYFRMHAHNPGTASPCACPVQRLLLGAEDLSLEEMRRLARCALQQP